MTLTRVRVLRRVRLVLALPSPFRVSLLFALALFSLACGATPPPRTVYAYPPAIESEIHAARSYPRPRALTDSLALDVSRSEDEMAADFAARIDRATSTCTLRRITHAPGSAEVTVDLGAGCKAGSGVMNVTFAKAAEGTALSFRFREFSHDGYFLDGALASSTVDGRVFDIEGSLPWKDLGDDYVAPIVIASSGGGGGSGRFGFGSMLIAAEVVRRVFTSFFVAF